MSFEKDKPSDKGLLARTATYTTKRARRAQTKLKQRVGKGDETKDEVFDEFLLNFNKQQMVAGRLHTELKNYLRCINAMQVAATTFSDAVSEVYEDDWTGKDMLIKSFAELNSNWTKLSISLTDEVLEPLTAYQKPFPDVKIRINKRARKLVDYDHSRHIVDTLRAKGATKSSDAKKLQQAEEEYQKSKDVFIDLTSELYEELPALYDSRIGFYVSCFQSIFTLEEVFHRSASETAHQLNDLMDQLITDFSAGTYSTRKPFAAGMETTSNSSEKENDDNVSHTSGLAQFYDVAVPHDDNESNSVDSPYDDRGNLSSDLSLNDGYDDANMKIRHGDNLHDSSGSGGKGSVSMGGIPDQPSRTAPGPPPVPERPAQPPTTDLEERSDEKQDLNITSDDEPVKKPDPPIEPPSEQIKPAASSPKTNGNAHGACGTGEAVAVKSESDEIPSNNIVAYKNQPCEENPHNLIVPSALYKVMTTHKYAPEDDDELSFERGEVIHVIPYEDPEEQDEGWLMGVMDSTGLVGVFPENFSRPLR